jgi:hypothetical protein
MTRSTGYRETAVFDATGAVFRGSRKVSSKVYFDCTMGRGNLEDDIHDALLKQSQRNGR